MMSLKIVLYGKNGFFPFHRFCMPSSSSTIVHKQNFYYYLNRQTFNHLPPPPFTNRIESDKGFSTKFVYSKIHCLNISSSSSSKSLGKSTPKPKVKIHEETEEEIARYADGDLQDFLQFLQTVIGNNEFNYKALTTTIKVLFHRLQEPESPSMDQTILNCVETLYDPIVTHLDTLDLDSLIRLLHIFVVLQAPTDHAILLGIFTLLEKKYRGQLNLHQIVHLESVLQYRNATTDSPISTSLKSTLPLYFERRLNCPLEPKDLEILAAENEDLVWTWNPLPKEDPTIVQALVDDILNNILHLNYTQAYNFLLFLTNFNVQKDVEGGEKLLGILFKTLADKINLLDADQLAVLVTKCAEKFENGDEAFYNADFMNNVHPNDIRNIRAASTMGHVDERFLFNVSNLAEFPGRLMNPDLLLAYVHLFGTAGHEPFHMDPFIKNKILDHSLQTMLSPQLNVRLTLDLLAIRRKPFIEFIEKIFQPTGTTVSSIPLEDCGLEKAGFGPIPLLLIRRAMSIFHFDPHYEDLMSSSETLEYLERAAKDQSVHWQFPIKDCLEKTLGEPDFVTTDLWHQGIHIDHCIVMNKEDGSLTKTPKDVRLDDVTNDTSKFPIILKVHPKHHFIANKRTLRGVYDLETRILKTMGFPLLDINLMEWNNLDEEGRKSLLVNGMDECWKKTIEST